MKITLADRIKNLPPYLFAEIDRLKAEQMKKDVDVIDLGVGDPDRPTPSAIIAALQKSAEDPANHQYPSYTGMNSFREAAAFWMKNRFGLALDPISEVVSLIGSKEGIANFPLAFVNPGDVVLVPSPDVYIRDRIASDRPIIVHPFTGRRPVCGPPLRFVP